MFDLIGMLGDLNDGGADLVGVASGAWVGVDHDEVWATVYRFDPDGTVTDGRVQMQSPLIIAIGCWSADAEDTHDFFACFCIPIDLNANGLSSSVRQLHRNTATPIGVMGLDGAIGESLVE